MSANAEVKYLILTFLGHLASFYASYLVSYKYLIHIDAFILASLGLIISAVQNLYNLAIIDYILFTINVSIIWSLVYNLYTSAYERGIKDSQLDVEKRAKRSPLDVLFEVVFVVYFGSGTFTQIRRLNGVVYDLVNRNNV